MLMNFPISRWISGACCALWCCAANVAHADNHTAFGDDLSAYMAPDVTESMLLDGDRHGGRMLVVGEYGHVILSDDEGATWRQAESPTRSALTGVTFADDTTAFAVGHDAVILRSTDGGSAWERIYFEPDLQTPLLDVWFADAKRGFAVGAYGLFLETIDGGDTWTRRPFFSEPLDQAEGLGANASADDDAAGDDAMDDDAMEDEEFEDDFVDPELGEEFHLNHITAAADGTLYIAAEAGRFYRSDDDGTTWLRLTPPYSGSLFGTLPLDGDALLVFGMRGNLFHSPDKGVTFNSVDTGVEDLLTAAVRGEGGRLLLVGMAGTVLESADDGRSFTLRRQVDRLGNMMVLPVSERGIILIGESGVTRLTETAFRAGGKP